MKQDRSRMHKLVFKVSGKKKKRYGRITYGDVNNKERDITVDSAKRKKRNKVARKSRKRNR